jgi:hypothetical protein
LLEAGFVSLSKLREFDYAVYGGGLYAGGVLGVNRVAKNQRKNLAAFAVGLADPQKSSFRH